jgi:hypothetical protein
VDLRVNCEMASLYRAERTFPEKKNEGERGKILPSKCSIIGRREAHCVRGFLVDKQPVAASYFNPQQRGERMLEEFSQK